MRDYGKIHTTFWSSQNIKSLSDDGRLLALYLLSSPHGTILGAFRMPDGYVCEDMNWDIKRVRDGFSELFINGFCNRCEKTKWVWIYKHLDWNAPENPNQWKAAGKIAAQIPVDCSWWNDFFLANTRFEPIANINGSETVTEPFLNQKQEQEQKQYQEQEKKISVDQPVEAKPEKTQRGTRLPANWSPTQTDIEYCRTQRPDLLPERVAENFRDYWLAKAGASATKLDWPATWRTWVRNEKASVPNNRGAPNLGKAGAATATAAQRFLDEQKMKREAESAGH